VEDKLDRNRAKQIRERLLKNKAERSREAGESPIIRKRIEFPRRIESSFRFKRLHIKGVYE